MGETMDAKVINELSSCVDYIFFRKLLCDTEGLQDIVAPGLYIDTLNPAVPGADAGSPG